MHLCRKCRIHGRRMLMAYVALYRQWRPQNFAALVGQQPVKQALTNALNSGRIAHAYLFAGPRGTGKTSTARILAKALNCVHGPTAEPCGECENCRHIAEGTSMDVFEIDAASNRGIDEIKALRDQLAFTPVDCRYKVYIIDEVHMLTTEAFNALLKTLEEPPAHVIFILATTDPHKIPATIHSRCQRFDFRRVTVEEITEHLAFVAKGSGLDAETEALRLIAIQAQGGMRDALSLLDQCGVMAEKITVSTVSEVLGIVEREALRALVESIGKQDVAAALEKLNLLLEEGKEVRQVLTELVEYFRALLLFKAVPDYSEIYLTDTAETLQKLAALYSKDRLMASEERLHSALQEMRGTMRQRITAELCLLDLCRREGSALASLTARVESLEQQLSQGITVNAAPKYTKPAASAAQKTTASSSPAVPQRQLYMGPEEAFSDSFEDEPSADELAQLAAASPVTKTQAENVAHQPQAQAVNTSPKIAAEITKQPPAAPKPVVQAAPGNSSGIEEFGGDYAAGEDFWRQALELVRAEKKMSMYSCAKDGRVYSFANDILVIAFKIAFKSERMNRDDFKSYFEDVLLRLARRPIRLQCAAESDVKKTSAAAAKPKAAPKPQPAADTLDTSQLPENLQKAMRVFGGTITKL